MSSNFTVKKFIPFAFLLATALIANAQCSEFNTASFPNDFTMECDEEILDFNYNTVLSSCGSTTFTLVESVINGNCSASYFIVREVTYEDGCGNSCTLNHVISIVDVIAPVFVFFPADISLPVGSGIPAIEWPVAADNCDEDLNIELIESTNGLSCPLVIERTFRATDNCGNQTIQTQTITIGNTGMMLLYLENTATESLVNHGFVITNNAGEVVLDVLAGTPYIFSYPFTLEPGCYHIEYISPDPLNPDIAWYLQGTDDGTLYPFIATEYDFSICGDCGGAGCLQSTACNYDPFAMQPGICFAHCIDADFGDVVPPLGETWEWTIVGFMDNFYQTGTMPFSGTFNLNPYSSYMVLMNSNGNNGWMDNYFMLSNPEWNWNTQFTYQANGPSQHYFMTGGPGCTNLEACNFNPMATIDDGSCILYGTCSDEEATNYDPNFICADNFACIYCDLSQVLYLNISDESTTTVNNLVFQIKNPEGTVVVENMFSGTEDESTYMFCNTGACGIWSFTFISGEGINDVVWTISDDEGNLISYTNPLYTEGDVLGNEHWFYVNPGCGCMDNYACNYDPSATVSYPESCIYCSAGQECVQFEIELPEAFVVDPYFSLWTQLTSFNNNYSFSHGNLKPGTNYRGYCVQPEDGCYQVTALVPNLSPQSCTWNMLANGEVILSGDENTVTTINLGDVVNGCTDAEACNYNPAANCNDNSCLYCSPDDEWCVQVALSQLAGNYGGGRIYIVAENFLNDTIAQHILLPGQTSFEIDYCLPKQVGCFRYVLESENENGTLIGTLIVDGNILFNDDSIDDLGTLHDGFMYTENGESVEEMVGCLNPEAINYEPSAHCHDAMLCQICTGAEYHITFNDSNPSIANDVEFQITRPNGEAVLFDMFSGAVSSQSFAFCGYEDCGWWQVEVVNFDLEELNFVITDNEGNVVLNSSVIGDTGVQSFIMSFETNPLCGCIDNYACNYDPLATVMLDNSCIYCDAEEECAGFVVNIPSGTELMQYETLTLTFNGLNTNYDFSFSMLHEGDNYFGFCITPVDGCYEVTASTTDYSAFFCTWSFLANGEVVLTGDQNTLTTINLGDVIVGCTDPDACNYNQVANCDDASCSYFDFINLGLNQDAEGNPMLYALDCETFSIQTFINTLPEVTVEECGTLELIYADNTSEVFIPSPETSEGVRITPIVAENKGSGPYVLKYSYCCDMGNGESITNEASTAPFYLPVLSEGCTDPIACNYNESADCDDGSCIENCTGCTNPDACNYDASAGTDDGSCSFNSGLVLSSLIYVSSNCEGDSSQYFFSVPLDTSFQNLPLCGVFTYEHSAYGTLTFPASTPESFGVTGSEFGSTSPFDLEIYAHYGISETTILLENIGSGEHTITYHSCCEDIVGNIIHQEHPIHFELTLPSFTYGCMDPIAINYNQMANCDDGSCYYLDSDMDNDGWTSSAGDCNDSNPTVHPSATEVCGDGIDNNCDGYFNEGCGGGFSNNWANAPISNPSGSAYPLCSAIQSTLANTTVSVEGNAANVITGEDKWISFVAQSNGVSIQLTTAAFDGVIELQNSNGVQVDVENVTGFGGTEILNTASLVEGEQYWIGVRNYNSGLGTGAFSLCIRHLMDTYANSGSGDYPLCGNLKAKYVAANSYLHHFTLQLDGAITSYLSSGQLNMSSLVPALHYDETYIVQIDALFNLFNGAGVPEVLVVPGVISHTIHLLPHAAIQVWEPQRCPAILLKSSVLKGKPFVCGAEHFTYEFQQIDISNTPVGTPFTINTTGSSCALQLNFNLPQPLINGGLYQVRIKPIFSYGEGTYGPAHCIQLINTNSLQWTDENEFSEEDSEAYLIYPNPGNGWECFVQNDAQEGDWITCNIYNQLGALVGYKRQLSDGSGVSLLTMDEKLVNGVYLLVLQYTDKSETIKWMVNE